MATAPFCEVHVTGPVGAPAKPFGFQKIPANATTQQITQIINNNFNLLAPMLRGGNWAELKAQRVTQNIRVFNPQDHGQYVDVEVINRVVMQDGTTGATWVWNRS